MSVGCAAERDPINRVQPQAIPKSFFVGKSYMDPADDPEFYARTMVIDVPYGADSSAFTFTNTINVVTRIKWSIQEDLLLGRVSYERLPGTDGKGTGNGKKSLEGQVAYAFRIKGHFDIRRSYNSATGEESNVIEENTSDRPWMDRDYIRVDFSQNLNTSAYDFDTLSFLKIFNGFSYEPLKYDVTDPNAEDAPQYDLKGGYFDVTNKVFAKPGMVNLPEEWGGGSFPACMLPAIVAGGQEPNGLCNALEVTLRHSFKRVVDTDYEPADWDGFKFQAFGAFMSERQGFQREYGVVDHKWYRFVERYNIWQRHHYYKDPAGMTGAVTCKVDTDCDGVGGVGGSHCDTFKSKCTLPYRKREVKPIVWYYADKSNPDFFESTQWATFDWDAAMRQAVAASRYAESNRYGDGDAVPMPPNGQIAEWEDLVFLVREVEACRAKYNRAPDEAAFKKKCDGLASELGQKRGYSDAVIRLAQAPAMVMLCHSPVTASDPSDCGPVGKRARLGDLRNHLIAGVDAPQTGSPWGIMSDASDPLTGEKISASANVWTDVNDRFAQGIVDVLRYIAGELKTEDVTEGTYIYNWAEAARLAARQGSVTPLASDEDVSKRVQAALGVDAAKIKAYQGKPLPAEMKMAIKNVENKLHDLAYAVDAPSTTYPRYNQRRKAAQNTPIEAELTTPAMQQLARTGPTNLAGDPTTSASVFRGLNPTLRRQVKNALELGYARRGVCVLDSEFAATTPLGYVALGDILQEKFGKFDPSQSQAEQFKRAQQMKNYIRTRAHYAVMAHEMGHSFALRHNFVSSSDPINYRPQYWQLRTNDKQSTAECTGPVTDGRTCVGSRRFDPLTQNESKNLIHMWAQSSTMEYPGEPVQDFLALGAYDFGAAMAFYGDVAAVLQNGKRGSTLGDINIAHQGDFGGLLGIRYDLIGHYSQLDRQLELITDCQEVDPQAFKPTNWNTAVDGEWSPLLDGFLVTNEAGRTTRCKQQPLDFVQFGQLNQPNAKSGREDKAYSYVGGGDNRVRAAFGFASDDWADLGNVSVYRHDNGADVYELMQFWISQQEVNHIFNNYRRGRTDFSVYSAFNRALGRYHEKMRDAGKAMGLFFTLARETAAVYSPQDGDAMVANLIIKDFPENMLASSITFDHFAHVFARPQLGDHGFFPQTNDNVLRSFDDTGFVGFSNKLMVVPNGVTGGFGQVMLGGRPIENALARNKGNYDRDYTINCGSYYEKAFVGMLFTESADNFISSSRGDFHDPRYRAVSIADVFQDGFRRWLGNNLTNDDAIKGPRVRTNGNNRPEVDAASLPTAGLGWTAWWPKDGIEACFPGPEAISCRTPNDTNPIPGANGTLAVDPQVGWEQQKFAIAMTLMYLPENQKMEWLNQIYIFNKGDDPGFANRLEFHDPNGEIFIAKTIGTENLYGKTVQKGIGARVLEWANELLNKGYQTTSVTQNGQTWYVPVIGTDGKAVVKHPTTGAPVASCAQNPACVQLERYTPIIRFVRQAFHAYNYSTDMRGIYK
jgi:hypothetical protein